MKIATCFLVHTQVHTHATHIQKRCLICLPSLIIYTYNWSSIYLPTFFVWIGFSYFLIFIMYLYLFLFSYLSSNLFLCVYWLFLFVFFVLYIHSLYIFHHFRYFVRESNFFLPYLFICHIHRFYIIFFHISFCVNLLFFCV